MPSLVTTGGKSTTRSVLPADGFNLGGDHDIDDDEAYHRLQPVMSGVRRSTLCITQLLNPMSQSHRPIRVCLAHLESNIWRLASAHPDYRPLPSFFELESRGRSSWKHMFAMHNCASRQVVEIAVQ